MVESHLLDLLRSRFSAAIATVLGDNAAPIDPLIRVSQDAKFGDYQCNAAMSLAKRLSAKPHDVAKRIAESVDLGDIAEPLEIAGPGFLNIRLKNDFLAAHIADILAGSDEFPGRLGVAPTAQPLRVIVEYSSPNVAKLMHVGHLRSTILGDVFGRVLSFIGHDVIRQNHVGDWGTQFGMLIAWYADHPMPSDSVDFLAATEEDYKLAYAKFREDAEFAERARLAVGRLQSGDPDARCVWQQICRASRAAFLATYRQLRVLLTDEDVRGESFYNGRLADCVESLRRLFPQREPGIPTPSEGFAEFREDAGAQCVFLYDAKGQPRYKGPDGNELPVIVQKKDGAYLYASTDLAALRFRAQDLKVDRIIYVTDARQKLHFQMFFGIARLAGWAPPSLRLDHVTFGSVLGEDGTPLKTRDGQNVKLHELLEEAVARAAAVVDENEARRAAEPGYTPLAAEERARIARAVGIGAVKYADLSRDRNGDYLFSFDRMLSMQGNTAPYMLYAYARIRSIYRKAAERDSTTASPSARLTLSAAAERALALRIARFGEAIDIVAADLLPHVLCAYLYDLAADFMRFYEECPVLQADGATRASRLRLCDLTARALRLGLDLLGIETIDRM
ncbi:MAG: arginine--tRNA ligase [Phycisphaerales bacterium]|nr:arginine--tRNA ligase [Phycisphaerales bacterium]